MPAKSASLRALGDAIRAARVERGYTQETFAVGAGIDRAYYGAVERGEFNLTLVMLLRIAAGLNVTAAAVARAREAIDPQARPDALLEGWAGQGTDSSAAWSTDAG